MYQGELEARKQDIGSCGRVRTAVQKLQSDECLGWLVSRGLIYLLSRCIPLALRRALEARYMLASAIDDDI